MQRDERLSTLIGEIYDAALNPLLWPRALEGAARFVRGCGASVLERDSARKTGSSFYDWGGDPKYRELFFSTYAKLDPLSMAYLCLDVGEVTCNSKLIPHAEFLETRFYKEWAKPQGFVDNVFTLLEKSATSIAVFVVFRHERDGLTDAATRARMGLLVPHMRRAVLIGNVIDWKTEEAASFADTLDNLSAGIFLVDAGGRLVHANASGRTMLADRALLTERKSGTLAVNEAGDDRHLQDAVLAAASGDASLGVQGVALSLSARTGDRYVAHVLPLGIGMRQQAGAEYKAKAALFVHKAARDSAAPPEIIAKTFKLTPTELRVLFAIVEVGGGPEVAEALGITENTVKTHLKRLYAKTGAGRQADLVKLMAKFSSPLIGGA